MKSLMDKISEVSKLKLGTKILVGAVAGIGGTCCAIPVIGLFSPELAYDLILAAIATLGGNLTVYPAGTILFTLTSGTIGYTTVKFMEQDIEKFMSYYLENKMTSIGHYDLSTTLPSENNYQNELLRTEQDNDDVLTTGEHAKEE